MRKGSKEGGQAPSDLYVNLDPWQKAQVARHPERPHAVDYIESLISEFTPMAGDRKFAEDFAQIGGLGRFRDEPVMVIGQEKGNDTTSRIKRNFGMARPEGYRKAVRLMEMAERFGLPVSASSIPPELSGHRCGRTRPAEASRVNVATSLGVPTISIIIGEGGSGGAIAIATTNVVLMLEHAIYSVISPEGAASILWRDAARAKDAAAAMKITAQDLKKLGIIDEIVPEPKGGAHRGRPEAIAAAGEAIARALKAYDGVSGDVLRTQRREKFLSIGRGL
jgi:acetyl-CoA carboxylase carboxyl transferase subunit alpha